MGLDAGLLEIENEDELRGAAVRAVWATADLNEAVAGTDDAYLRLQLLSYRLVRPNEVSLDGLFLLRSPNIWWTTLGPVHPDDLTAVRLRCRASGTALQVNSVDKFPKMVDYVVPSGVRIGDGSRVRLGEHVAAGTTVMHEGFVNFNAGTLGAVRVEGRIIQGVVVDDGSDIGGGASTMGTLSGGGREKVSIGQRCLLGANAGLDIAFGDDSHSRSWPLPYWRYPRLSAQWQHRQSPGILLTSVELSSVGASKSKSMPIIRAGK